MIQKAFDVQLTAIHLSSQPLDQRVYYLGRMSTSEGQSDFASPAHFWHALFEQEQLASQLNRVAASLDQEPPGLSYHLAQYGELQLMVKRATAVGDGFMSDAYLLKATTSSHGKKNPFTAFVKVMPSNPFMKASAVSQRLYDREVGIYQYFHPLLRKARKEKGLTELNLPLNVPDIYYTNLCSTSGGQEEKSNCPIVLVMEDLKSQGFAMVDKLVGCTFEEATATLTTLAFYHALSVVVVRQWKTSGGEYALPEPLGFVREKTMFDAKGHEMLATTLPFYVEIVQRMGNAEAASWLEIQARDIVDIMTPEDVGLCGPLSCLLHADCWNNNMMYRSSDSNVIEMRLVDWQITRLGHPVTDCLHFLFSSTSPEMRANHFTRLMADYFTKLDESLRKLGVHLKQEGYSEADFHLDVKKRLRWGLFMALMILPAILDDSMASQVDNYDEEDVKQLSEYEVNQDEFFKNMRDKMKDMFTVDSLMKNRLLCHRLSQLVIEVKSAFDQ